PKPVTELDTSQEASHRWPQFLPDGRHFLYFILSGDPQRQGMYAGSLDSNQKTRLVPTPVSGIYGMGILLFVHEQALLGQRLDARGFRLVGDAFPVAEPVGVDAAVYRSRVSLSETGVLIYDAGGSVSRRMQWFDRNGKAFGTVGPPGEYFNVDLSPDGRR